MIINVGINGFGRIGRIIFRACVNNKDLEVSAINDPAIDVDYICYLIKFDSTHGKFKGDVTYVENEITIDGKIIKVFHERVPASIPWQSAGVHYVVEASGIFTSLEKASGHLTNESVKRVIVTAPSLDVPMLILGVNEQDIHKEHKVISCASSTLYCLAPIIKILEQQYGICEGFITSIHAMTPSLKPLDGLCLRGKHWRDHRSIHQNIIPAATGACKALNKIIPQVKDKMSGIAFRVPIVNVSVLDISIRLNKNTTIEDIIKRIDLESQTNMKHIIKTCNDEAVSSDFAGDEHSCILDIKSCLQLTPNFFKLICWYENEFSYACRVVDSIKFCKRLLNMELKPKINYNRLLSRRLFHEQSVPYFCKQNFDNKMTKSSCHDVNIKQTFTNNQILIQKPLPLNISINQSSLKRKELFKVWNNEVKIDLPIATDNKTSILHSCLTFGPCKCHSYLQNQERLLKVKEEVAKMVDKTEHLLNKPNNLSKFENDYKLLLKSNDTKKNTSSSCGTSFNQIYEDILKTNIEETTNNRSDLFKNDLKTLNASKTKNYLTNKENINDSLDEILENTTYNILPDNTSEISQELRLSTSKRDYSAMSSQQTIDECIEKTSIESYEEINIKNEDKTNKECLLESSNKIQDDIKGNNAEKINDTEQNMSNDIHQKEINNQCEGDKIGKHKQDSNNRCQEKLLDQYHAKANDRVLNCIFETKNHVPSGSLVSLVKDNPSNLHVNSSCEQDSLNNNALEIANYSKVKVTNNQYEPIVNTLSLTPIIPENATSLENADQVDIDKIREKRRKIIQNIIKKLSAEKMPKANKSSNIFDKLDSASDTDSENSFHMNEKKSQVIHLSDLTSSTEDLSRLDKICRIIELSDELSDALFSALDNNNQYVKNKTWSFKDLCERLKLDEFCNKVFGRGEKDP